MANHSRMTATTVSRAILAFVLAPLLGCGEGDPGNRPSVENAAAPAPVQRGSPDPAETADRRSPATVLSGPLDGSHGATAAAPPPSPQAKQDEPGDVNVRKPAAEPAPNVSFADVVRLALPGTAEAQGYAYDARTGDLAVIGPWKDRLAIVPLEKQRKSGRLQDVQQVKLLGAPYKLAYKATKSSGLFAVSQTDPNGVLLVDVRSREVVKAIKLADKPASFLPAVGPAGPYLYFTTLDRQGDGEIFRSPDGSFHMPDSSVIEVQRLNVETMALEEPLRISRLNSAGHAVVGDVKLYYWRDFASASFHANGRFTFQGNKVYDADFTHVLSVLKVGAKEFLTDGPWVVGVTRDELVVCSINDGRIVTGVPIPSGYQRVAEVFVDAGRGCVVVGLGKHVVIVPLAKLVLPDEPILIFEEQPATVAELHKTYEFPLRTVSGNPTIELAEGPEGMAIEGSVLRWRCETAYTGPVNVKLKITAGEVTREQSWKITVQ